MWVCNIDGVVLPTNQVVSHDDPRKVPNVQEIDIVSSEEDIGEDECVELVLMVYCRRKRRNIALRS